jgi:hypothetical protein
MSKSSVYYRLRKAYGRMMKTNRKLLALQKSVSLHEKALNIYQDKYGKISSRGWHYSRMYGKALKNYKNWQIRDSTLKIDKLGNKMLGKKPTVAQMRTWNKLNKIIESAQHTLSTYDWEH